MSLTISHFVTYWEGIEMRPTNRQDIEMCLAVITKWQKIKNGTGVDEGTLNCCFCNRYYYFNCKQCPIFELFPQGSRCGCHHTPYNNWKRHFETTHSDHYYNYDLRIKSKRVDECCDPFIDAEIDFLKTVFRQVLLHLKF
jgi:hypothetical protein